MKGYTSKDRIIKRIRRGNIEYTIVDVVGLHGLQCTCHSHYEVRRSQYIRVDKLDEMLKSPDEEVAMIKMDLLLNDVYDK